MMATTTEDQPQQDSDLIYRTLKTLRGSFLLSTAAAGVVLLTGAALFEFSAMLAFSITSQDGIIAGMLGVFGVSAIVAGGSFYGLLKLIRRRSEAA